MLVQGEHPCSGSLLVDLKGRTAVEIGRADETRIEERGGAVLMKLADSRVSKRHARLAPEGGKWRITDRDSRNGVVVSGHRLPEAVLRDGDLIELGSTVLLFREDFALGLGFLDAERRGFRTMHLPLAEKLAALELVARDAGSILVLGETGTGKELVARAVHELSGRSGAFVAFNCAALPESLAVSELFGAQSGSFTGATATRRGLVHAAHGGTLFLDEVGDMPLLAQAALLRTLQGGEVRSVGQTLPDIVDVRVVAATNVDLTGAMAAGDFRRDLYARLAGFIVQLPALRERREDLGFIVAALAQGLTPDLLLHPETLRAFYRHDWPKNVRELKSALEVGVSLGRGCIAPEHLPDELRAAAVRPTWSFKGKLVERERALRLVALMREHGGNISAVASAMGKQRLQVRRWLERYGLEKEAFY